MRDMITLNIEEQETRPKWQKGCHVMVRSGQSLDENHRKKESKKF